MFKPLLAAKLDLDRARFPLLASPKLDGIRAILMADHGLVSRNMKPIPNDHIRSVVHRMPTGLDGELMTYTDGKPDNFNTLTSKIMSRDGAPDFKFHVFDWIEEPSLQFRNRLHRVSQKVMEFPWASERPLEQVPHILVNGMDELYAAERRYVDDMGYEGVMLRDPEGRYKYGRSTVNEQILLKMKRFFDAEAVVTGFVEREINNNEQTRDALGRAKRSTAKAGKTPAGDLGALVCQFNNVEFELGTGFTAAQRIIFWGDLKLVGKKVTFKYQELTPAGVPRFPVFIGFREDM